MKIAILGAGVAGCSIAGALVRAGFDVHVVDAASGPAQETSGHRAALAHPHLTRFPTPLQQLTKRVNQYVYENWGEFRLHTGAFQVMPDENWVSQNAMIQRIARLGLETQAVVMDEKVALLHTAIERKGVWYPQAGVYDLVKIANTFLARVPKANQYWEKKIKSVTRHQNQWLMFDEQSNEVLRAEVLILANGLSVKELLNTIDVDVVLRSVRGQLSRFRIDKTSDWIKYLPKVPLTGGGYTTPYLINQDQYEIQVGSSYDEDNWEKKPWEESDLHNKNQLRELIGQLNLPLDDLQVSEPFVGLRCVAKDRMPFIGPIDGYPGLFVATAFGARGVLWSALAQLLITSYVQGYFEGAAFFRAGFLAGASLEEEATFAAAVSPTRFFAGAPLAAGRASNSKPTLPSG